MLDLDPLILSSFHPLLVELGAGGGLIPPFIQFSQLNFFFPLAPGDPFSTS